MILKSKNLFLILFSLLTCTCFAQKVKYKDLFVLLQAKQYDQAEPHLKRYLKESQDNPNAFLFMGYIYEEKALANDVLKETKKLYDNSDSAVYYFDRAFKEIDEKELKKNEEYYQAYSRRDLRTGKFGLKLSDIQLDLEKKMKALKDRRQRVLSLNERFNETQDIYKNCDLLFKSIAERNKNQKEFYLRADERLTNDLGVLSRKYDSCLISFNDYRIFLEGLGKTGYNQELDPREIIDFKKDGYSSVDFYQDELKFWDYKRWAVANLDVIQKEILPMTDSLVKLDAGLNALREKIKKDSVSVVGKLPAIIGKINATGLSKFDPKPMPNEVFSLKIKELEYASELAQAREKRDSASLPLKLALYSREIILLGRIDSVASLLMQRDFDYEAENYKAFIQNSYGSASVLKNLIKSTGDFAVAEKAEKAKQVKNIEQVLNWVLDQTDSIPAVSTVTSKKYFPLSIVPESHTFGLTFPDSTTSFAYFYAISPSRQATIKTNHKLDSVAFRKANLPLTKGISTKDASKDEFFVVMYSEQKRRNKIPCQVYKVTRTDGLAWSKYYALEGTPIEATYGKETGDLTLKISTDIGNKVVTIQKDGKQL